MNLNDITSKTWLDTWFFVVTIGTILFTIGALFFEYFWGLAYTGFFVGLVLRIKYIKTEFFGLSEIAINFVFMSIVYIVFALLITVPEIFVIIYSPNPEAIPLIILYFGYIMCPILAGFLRQKFKNSDLINGCV